jgi:hypothetical protein
MPYKDPEKQKKANREATRRYRSKQKEREERLEELEELERKRKMAADRQKKYRERQKEKKNPLQGITLHPGIENFEYNVNRTLGENPEITFKMKGDPALVSEIQTFLINLALDKDPSDLFKISFV